MGLPMMGFPCRSILASALLCVFSLAQAAVTRDLPLPKDTPDAENVARQVYFANHLYAFDDFSIRRKRGKLTVLINRDADGKTTRLAVERFINNNYRRGAIKSRDLAIFRSGKLRGTGILVTEYFDPDKSNSYSVWLPALRKVRRFAEPAQDESWGGSVFTFGDVSLRRPSDETHELLGTKPFRSCLGVITELEGHAYKYVRHLPRRSCRHIGKSVYGLKSTSRFPDWWYDYRISFVDTHTFADYRSVYYKDGRPIKIIDRDWGRVEGANKKDPRALFWKYWYGVDLLTGRESWAVVPWETIEFDHHRPARFWSERTLRRLKR